MDQPMANEGSMNLMIPGMACRVSPGPTMITTVASTKISVVLPNRNIFRGEKNKDPLERERKLRKSRKEGGPGGRRLGGKATHSWILIETKYTTRSIPAVPLEDEQG